MLSKFKTPFLSKQEAEDISHAFELINNYNCRVFNTTIIQEQYITQFLFAVTPRVFGPDITIFRTKRVQPYEGDSREMHDDIASFRAAYGL
jgi:hypothetical protein